MGLGGDGTGMKKAASHPARIVLAILLLLGPPAAAVATGEPQPAAHPAGLGAALDSFGGSGNAVDRNTGAVRASEILVGSGLDSTALAAALGHHFVTLRRPLDEDVQRLLARLAFETSDRTARKALQDALASVLAAQIESLFRSTMPDLDPRLVADPVLRETVVSSLHLLARLAFEGRELTPGARRALYRSLQREIRAYPTLLRRNVTLDRRARPWLPTIRAQLYQIMRDATPLRPAAFAADTGFSGRYARILQQRGVLVLDNNGLKAAQLDAIERLLDAVPASLHDTTRISVHALLGTPREPDGRWLMTIAGGPGFNISDAIPGRELENPFPPDADPVPISVFCAVLQHELNHVIHDHRVRRDPALASRHEKLIARAGIEPHQYLRSQIEATQGPGVFVSAPQEFMASIANVYLANSLRTLEIAYERHLRGYREPLQQFLFFVDLYSDGGDSSIFYAQDSSCGYETQRVTVKRDERGFIRRLVADGVPYEFQRGPDGNLL